MKLKTGYFNSFAILLITALLVSACDDNDDGDGIFILDEAVEFSVPVVSGVGVSSATLTATYDMEDSLRCTSAGFCYDVKPQPTIYKNIVECKSPGKQLTTTISGLTEGVTYYVRAYVCVYNKGTVYSPQVELRPVNPNTSPELQAYKAPEYPDDYTAVAAWSQRDQWNLANVHDPSVVLAEDGYYYMYQTDASYGNAHTAGGHFHARRSKNLIDWESLGGTMQSLPEWIVPKLNEIRAGMGLSPVNPAVEDFGYWAPVVRKVRNGLYRMYYSIVVPGYIDGTADSWGERAFIGLMENTNPADNSGWVDKGYVITNASDRSLDYMVGASNWGECYYKFNAIDPSYIITDSGEHWLIYGSWHSGIAAVRLNADTGKPEATLPAPWGTAEDIAPYGQLIHTRDGGRWQASEGPEVIYRNGYYYLFLAYDALDVAYNTRVVRSKNITGPYLGIDGTDVTAGGEALPVVTHPYRFGDDHGWVGISHCAVFSDGQDNWFYASQGRFPANWDGNQYSNALMMGQVRSIRWTDDGWPLVMPERYGAVPQVEITEDELVGRWAHIDMSYRYGVQKASAEMTFADNHTVSSGAWQGCSWSYDPSRRVIKVSNGMELYIQRECDWEASVRCPTIVYACYGSNGKTYWGKKE